MRVFTASIRSLRPGHEADAICSGAPLLDRPCNRAEFDRKIGADIQTIVAATVLLLAWVLAVSGSATGDAVSTGVLDAPIITYLVSILGYCAYLVWGARYRVPDPGPDIGRRAALSPLHRVRVATTGCGHH